mmetsp:Transcript_48088/g.70480  ORF Transcript_48088/g.70480 Transcript_48088/m.70480 type:complete len:136 (+) Transcript_48088:37-444(+)
MDASRVLGTLRAHCDRLELELRELDADLEEAKAMLMRNGKPLEEPLAFLQRLRASKAAKLHETEQSLFALASTYDKGAALLSELQPITPSKYTHSAPWSTLKKSGNDGRITVVTTSSPILQFASRPDLKVLRPPQ